MSKLYAKITNEAGKTAGKSGTERLTIEMMVGNENIGTLCLRKGSVSRGYDGEWIVATTDGYVIAHRPIKTGKTQKDKYCTRCGYVEAQSGIYCKKCGTEMCGKI